MKVLLFLLPALVAADTGYGYKPEPKKFCRDTNSSVYAEVCVPAFTSQATPITLDVKKVVDSKYCYKQTHTVCEENTRIQPREICTYTYQSKKETGTVQTTKVTYETKTETIEVTTCAPAAPSGYGVPKYGGGEEQVCSQAYQTESYKVPLVSEPEEMPVDLEAPEAVKECVTKEIEITEVTCNDIVEEKCIDLAKFEDDTVTIDQVEVVLGEPKCEQLTLTLPTKACSKGYH